MENFTFFDVTNFDFFTAMAKNGRTERPDSQLAQTADDARLA